jgi:hypothetical protein
LLPLQHQESSANPSNHYCEEIAIKSRVRRPGKLGTAQACQGFKPERITISFAVHRRRLLIQALLLSTRMGYTFVGAPSDSARGASEDVP